MRGFLTAVGIALILLGVTYSVPKWLDHVKRQAFVELTRLPSPDRLYDALLIDNLASGGILLYIVRSGATLPDTDHYTLAADKVHGLALSWTDNKTLEIHFQKARIHKYHNTATFPTQAPFFDTVELVLIKDGNEPIDLIHD